MDEEGTAQLLVRVVHQQVLGGPLAQEAVVIGFPEQRGGRGEVPPGSPDAPTLSSQAQLLPLEGNLRRGSGLTLGVRLAVPQNLEVWSDLILMFP